MRRVVTNATRNVSLDKERGHRAESHESVAIAVNAEFLASGRPDGIPRASFGLVRAMAAEDGSITWLLFTPRIKWQEAAEQLRALPNCKIFVSGLMAGRAGRVGWRLFILPWLARRHRVRLLFNPVGNGPAWMPRSIRLVITIHDLAWLDGHRWYSPGYRFGQRLLSGRAARLATQVFAVSSYSAQQIEKCLRVAPSRVTVVRNGLRAVGGSKVRRTPGSDGNRSTSPVGAQKQTALFVGTLIRRKNLVGVWRAFSRIRQEKGLDIRLVVVGAFRDSKALNRKLKADPNVRLLDYVGDQHLAALYREAAFLVMPSFYEGFGLPIVEAMALGTPVITSCTSALAEVAGGAALLVDPTNEDQIYLAMHQLLTDETLRENLRERGYVRARAFSWEISARVALKALSSVLSTPITAVT